VSIDSPIIELQDVSFAYGGNAVLEHISFAIEKGDYVGIIGPNGGGKTALLKIIVGLLSPQSGEVLINGTPTASFRKKSEIGYVPQRIVSDSASFPATVYEVVESGRIPQLTIFGRTTAQDKTAVIAALVAAQIGNLENKLMSELSGGQRQRVYVARALASESQVLILDEPFVGVDIATQKEFYAFLKKLNDGGLTILFVSHDIDVITEEAKSILCLNRGLLCFGSSELLQEKNIIEGLYGKRITHIHHTK
jgi:zinc transport system ATP-binding protein